MTTADQPVGEDFVTDYRPTPLPLRFDVYGIPQPQGSTQRARWGGVYSDNKKPLAVWRGQIVNAAIEASYQASWVPLDCAVKLTATFFFPRPKGHHRAGKNAHLLQASAPRDMIVKPDLDKCLRAVGDALADAGVYSTDSRINITSGAKLYADHRAPGACITISEARA